MFSLFSVCFDVLEQHCILCVTSVVLLLLQAAHYIGLDCNVVLCIQHLSDDAIIGSDKVSQHYNNEPKQELSVSCRSSDFLYILSRPW